MRVGSGATPGAFTGLFLVGLTAVGGWDHVRAQAEPEVANSAGDAGIGLRQTAYLKASNTGFGDEFGGGGTLLGNAVALSADGTTLAIGAPYESSGSSGVDGNQDDESVYGAGAVYVYASDDGSWRQQAYVKASNPGLTDNFGYMIALSGDGNTMAVSAPYEASAATGIDGDQNDDSIPQAGGVYVFSRSGEAWEQQAYIKASNTGEAGIGDQLSDGDQFGFGLALSTDGNTLAVGAISEDSAATGANADQSDNSALSAGAVYVFSRTGDAWTQQAYVKASNPGGGDLFGYSVALSADGSVLAATAYDEDGSRAGTNEVQDDEVTGTGALYVFSLHGSEWMQEAYLKPSNSERNDAFGVAVAISADGNTVVGTALDEDGMTTGVNSTPQPDMQINLSTGAVYLFARDDGAWSEQTYFKASNTGANDTFGARLALSGDGSTLAVGAQLEDSAGQGVDAAQDDDSAQEAGAVYLFTHDGSAWTQSAYVKGSNTEAFDEFGSAIALNGDGTLMAIGARGEDSGAVGLNADQNDNSAFEAGAVYVFGSAP